jgi:ATP-dependent DNA helicase RecQ
MRQFVVSTFLSHLVLLGFIQFDVYYYSDIRFEAHRTGAEILAGYSESQAAFLKKIFASCQKARKWITLDMDAAIERTGHPREVVLRALESLQEQRHITMQVAGYRQRFKRINPTVDREALCRKLYELFLQHEQLEIERIDAMVAYAQEETCLTNRLLVYFGEPIAPCGHCGVCKGDAPVRLAARTAAEVDSAVLAQISELGQAYARVLGQPRQQARFLCGMNSPAVTAQRALRGHPLFGSCGHIPFKSLLAQLS